MNAVWKRHVQRVDFSTLPPERNISNECLELDSFIVAKPMNGVHKLFVAVRNINGGTV